MDSLGSQELGKILQEEDQSEKKPDSKNRVQDEVVAEA